MATETVNGHPHPPLQTGVERGRRLSKLPSPTDKKVAPAERRNLEDLPRAASFTYIPDAKDRQYEQHTIIELKGVASAEYVAHAHDTGDHSPSNDSPPNSSGWTTPDGNLPTIAPPQPQEIAAHLRRTTSKHQRDHADQSGRSGLESSARHPVRNVESPNTVSTSTTETAHKQARLSLNRSFSRRLSRQSWYHASDSSPSRSPSPQKEVGIGSNRAGKDFPDSDGANDGRRKSLITRTLTGRSMNVGKQNKDGPRSSDEQELDKPFTRKGTILRKKAVRAAAGLPKITTDATGVESTSGAGSTAAVPAIPKSFSTEKLPTLSTSRAFSDRAAPVSRLTSPHKAFSSSAISLTKKRDGLWGVFRTLDADFVKFSSKSTTLKANVVRSTLIPFLRTYASHPSNQNLRPEDLDRRTNILNKWWTGLIELLHGRNNQSISGTDRPVILDGVSGIMERREWRFFPSPFCPLNQRIQAALSKENRSDTSLASSSSDFLAESVHHNVRNIFIHNLSAQMAFVVDKMSLRNASASLVAFCGKACAYAFMFVPGIAEILVRLWNLPIATLRRVLSENGIGKFDQAFDSSSDISSSFPPAIQQLGFTTLTKYTRMLRTPPSLPVGTAHIEWWGHWVERWSGRESDLFYVFVKHFHILATDFLPSKPTNRERICAPGMLLVHSQILTNLDATVHRDVSQSAQDLATSGPSATFEELLAEPDAIASSLPLLQSNSMRHMMENRLIMLIRDFLSDRNSENWAARDVFAQSFNLLLQAAARGTSVFDHSACFTLLDFLEEALVLMSRYEHQHAAEEPLLDAHFWQIVCKKMIESENTMTEIRLYAFLYTVWNTAVAGRKQKANLCIDILLDPDVFESRFNHWCPMVRSYFMRLLCWRVARSDDEDGSGDYFRVLGLMEERLHTTWAHFLYLREKAERDHGLPPDTVPCRPAPGRRWVIMRTDTRITPGNTFLTFDGLMKEGASGMQRPSQIRTSSATSTPTLLDGVDARPDSATSSSVSSESETRETGLGGFLRKMIGGSQTRSKSKGPSKQALAAPAEQPRSAKSPPPPLTRAATDEPQAPTPSAAAEPDVNHSHSATPPSHAPPPPPPHQSFHFKFSLEPVANAKALPPMRLLHPPRLPPAAHASLHEMRRARNTLSPQPQPQPQPEPEPAPHAAVPPPGATGLARARYSGRALAEWALVVGECYSFFERRKAEGVPGLQYVETPTLAVEMLKGGSSMR